MSEPVKNSNPSYMADFCRSALPANRGLYYDGGWHEAQSGRHIGTGLVTEMKGHSRRN
jgi:hypothetical protein